MRSLMKICVISLDREIGCLTHTNAEFSGQNSAIKE